MFDFETVLRMELEHLDLFTRKSEVRGSKRLCQSNGWARVDYLVRFLIFFLRSISGGWSLLYPGYRVQENSAFYQL